MNTRIAMLIGMIALSVGSSAFACGGSCYSPRVYRPVVSVPVHYTYGHRVQMPTRLRIAQPAPARLPAVPASVPIAISATPTAIVNPAPAPAPAVTPVAPSAKIEAPAPKNSDTDDNPFSKLTNLELIELSGVRQIIEGRN